MIHPASSPTRPLKEPILNSPATSHLLNLIWNFYQTSQLRLTPRTTPSFFEASSQFRWSPFLLVLLQPLQLLILLCRHLCLTFSCWSSVFIFFHAAHPNSWLILPPKCINDSQVFISSLDFSHKHENQGFSIGTSNSTPCQTPFSSRLMRGPGI